MPKRLLLLLCCMLPLLGGCSPSSGEKQIFPICMSMDRLEDGRMQLSVQVSSMAEGEGYAVFSAAGDNFRQALEILGASMPYPLHFGQLRLCMVSWQLLGEQPLRELLEPVAQLDTISPQVTAVAALGNAAQTMTAQQPDLGVRLSTYLDQLLARLRQEKLMPEETMLQTLHMLESGYGDPLLALCALHTDMLPEEDGSAQEKAPSAGQPSAPVFGQSGSIAIGEPSTGADLPPALTAGALPRQGGNPVEYTGCAVVGGSRVTGLLTAAETRLLLTLRRNAKVTQLCESGGIITIPQGVSLSAAAQLVTKLQLLRCDALRLGAYAARLYATKDAFENSPIVKNLFTMHLTITYK